MTDPSWYKNAFYRVSVKALICNDDGDILMVDEGGDGEFGLPGGGWDYGESLHECLVRELHEEIALISDFNEEIIGTYTFHNPQKDAWQLLIICSIDYDQLDYGMGQDADAVEWLAPSTLDPSSKITQRIAMYLQSLENGYANISI